MANSGLLSPASSRARNRPGGAQRRGHWLGGDSPPALRASTSGNRYFRFLRRAGSERQSDEAVTDHDGEGRH